MAALTEEFLVKIYTLLLVSEYAHVNYHLSEYMY